MIKKSRMLEIFGSLITYFPIGDKINLNNQINILNRFSLIHHKRKMIVIKT